MSRAKAARRGCETSSSRWITRQTRKSRLMALCHSPARSNAMEYSSRCSTSVGEEERFTEVVMSERETWQWRKTFKQGHVERQILQAADECRADLIVMTTRGHHGFLDALRGSTTERIVRNSTCPVLALPAYGSDQAPPQESVIWRPAV